MRSTSSDHRSTRIPTVSMVLIAALQVYRRAVSPALPPVCRYVPTCSEYAIDAICTHGAAKGVWMATTRIMRCHPGRAGGWDPVPARAISEEGNPDGPSDTTSLCSIDTSPVSIPVSSS